MPLDPNIALSFQMPQMPSYNAMVQQTGQNMANMMTMQNAIEARKQAQADSEEAAMAKALLPATATMLSDPSDAGIDAALQLVPPEFADAAATLAAQLKAIPDTKVRKTSIMSSLAQDKIGQTMLDLMVPSANAQLNADIAGQRAGLDQAQLAFQKQKFEAEQAAGPDASYTTVKGADGKTYLMNSKTGEMKAPKLEDGTDINAGATTGDMDPKVKVKLDQAYPKSAQALQSATTSLDQDIADVEALLQDPGLKDITGLFNANTPNVSANSRRAQALYDKIKSGAGFAALQNMRLSSPTGGALGNVSNQEGSKLEQSVAAFDQKQDYNDLRNALRTYLVDLKVAKENLQSAFDETYSYRGEAPSADIVSGAVKARQRLESETPMPGSTPKRGSLPPGVTVRRN